MTCHVLKTYVKGAVQSVYPYKRNIQTYVNWGLVAMCKTADTHRKWA